MNNYKQLILDNLSFDGYDLPNNLSDARKLYDVFHLEYGWAIGFNSLNAVCKDWLMGLPTVIDFPFSNLDILEWTGFEGADQAAAIVQYWNKLADALVEILLEASNG